MELRADLSDYGYNSRKGQVVSENGPGQLHFILRVSLGLSLTVRCIPDLAMSHIY
jgi:hypothetical protein